MGDLGSTRGVPSLTAAPERFAIARAGAPPRALRRSAAGHTGAAADEVAAKAPPGVTEHHGAEDPPPAVGTLRLVRLAGDQPPPQAVFEELERVLVSGDFDGTPRSRAFLQFILEETLGGRQDGLTQTALATHVFGRRQDFDPTIDPIVRIQAGRLRRSLERYYLLAGTTDPVQIVLPRGGYVPIVRWAAGRGPGGALVREPRRPDDWPCVVVGPFRTSTSDGKADETALRFCERLAFEIGRYADVRVVLQSELDKIDGSRPPAGRFALSGHLAGDAAHGRVVARLVDNRNAGQVWAEEFCGDAAATESNDEAARLIAARVASEHGIVARTLRAERKGRPSSEPTSYDAVLRSYQFLATRDPGDLAAALDALQRAVAVEPECGLAWVQLARLCVENYAYEVTPSETPIELAVTAAHNAAHLDTFVQRARGVLAHALFVKGELAAAQVEARRALDLDPRSFATLDIIGWLLTLGGDGERGPALIREAMERNPNCSPIVFHALWANHLRRGEIEESRRAAQQFRDRSSFWPGLTRACSLGHLGRLTEAKLETAELLARKPDFVSRGRALIGRVIRLPELFECVLQGLGKAGLVLD